MKLYELQTEKACVTHFVPTPLFKNLYCIVNTFDSKTCGALTPTPQTLPPIVSCCLCPSTFCVF